MDEGETKICQNCKREIPAINFTIHAVHCMRNIRICPVCKEPVPNAELQQHHDKMHKLLPCKQCGETVCGTDMEDHIRDSCAHTMKCCKFCVLELRRGALPAHERYCGARTERCACGEWVMHRYRALHLDSNHGFVRLDDDPEPAQNKLTAAAPKPSNRSQPAAVSGSEPDGSEAPSFSKDVNNTSHPGGPAGRPPRARPAPCSGPVAADCRGGAACGGSTPGVEIRNAIAAPGPAAAAAGSGAGCGAGSGAGCGAGSGAGSGAHVGAAPRPKGCNERPQENATAAAPDKVQKNLWASRGAVKKRPAPKPPGGPPPAPSEAPRDPVLRSALQRRQREDEQRREQTARNLAAGRPPVLSAADKLDKLRKMDAMHNLGTGDQDYKSRLTGRVWMPAGVAPPGHVLGAAPRSPPPEGRRDDLKDLKPMTPQEFMERFNELQLMEEPREERIRGADRFSQIKSSLRELRRGLNEVTAPYSSGTSGDANHDGAAGEERLPCEFCGSAVPAERLVLHQTGCRPDLAQLLPRERPAERPARAPSPPPAPTAPLIPCEFCAAPLPLHLVSDHQERCGRDAELLFPD